MTEPAPLRKIKVNDRVRRIGMSGCLGIVKDVRSEVTAAASEGEKGLLVNVHWDNGTQSYFGPEALEVVK